MATSKLFIEGDNFYLQCSFDDKLKAKKIPGYAWNKARKKWKYIADEDTFRVLLAIFPDCKVNQKVTVYLDRKEKRLANINNHKSDFFNKKLNEEYRNITKLPLHDHQLLSFDFFRQMSECADFSEPGAEKTLVQLALINYRMNVDGISNILIVCPKGIMEAVWKDDIEKFLSTDIPIYLMTKDTKTCSDLFKSDATGIFIINYEKLWRIQNIAIFKRFDMIILDESHRIKNHSSKQSKFIHKLNKIKYKSILTGTPVGNNHLDLFSQFKFLVPSLFGTSYYSFRDKFFFAGGFGGFEFSLKSDSEKQIKKMVDIYSISWKKSECKDLPPMVSQILNCEMKGEQLTAYNEMKEHMITFLNNEPYTAQIALTKLMRLSQITSGFLQNTDDSDDKIIFKQNPKLKLLKETLEGIPSDKKVIIWANFRQDIKAIKSMLGDSASVYYGGLNDKQKKEQLSRFKNISDVNYLIANPVSGGVGLNLSNANYSIYYSMNYSSINYAQSKERMNREGQKEKMTMYHLIVKDSIDELIHQTVQIKITINDFITNIKRK